MIARRGKKEVTSPGPPSERFGLGLLIVILGLVVLGTPFGREWEEDFGLTWLFRLRGPVAPPEEVVVVSIDRETSGRLGLPDNPRKWPRDLHARLLDRLTEQGASVVAFDLMFQEHRGAAADRAFAESVRRAGNVILFEFLKKDILPASTNGATDRREIVIEQRIPPIPALADAALGLAPYALPKVPIKVSRLWLFKPEAGGPATLPMAAFQAHRPESYDEILELARDIDLAAVLDPDDSVACARTDAGLRASRQPPEKSCAAAPLDRIAEVSEGRTRIHDQAERLRRLFLATPSLAPRLLRRIEEATRTQGPSSPHLHALIAAFDGPDSIYLNYYGPPRTIHTLSYHRVLSGESRRDLDLAGRAVFVGAAPRMQPEQRDGFYTPYTLSNGLDIGGVEIAATGFANLLDRNAITPLAPIWASGLVLTWGLALGMGLRRCRGLWIPWVAAGAGGAYFAVAYVAFVQAHLWLPLITPLVAQLLPASFGAILWRYRGMQRERENIRQAFGMHLPLSVVDQLARGIDEFTASAEHAYGICLATDAERYTTLSELMEPSELKEFMNSYYNVLFSPVRSRGGVVADVVGDAMLAIWASDTDRPELRKAACEAALEILEAVEQFNRTTPERRLPTRLGLHCGELVFGHVGALDHFEFRAVGDIVNTTSRIEGLGRQLGTRLLVSEDVVSGLHGLRVRPLGRFLLKGKRRPLSVFELMSATAGDDQPGERLQERFTEGLQAFREGDLNTALACFEAIELELGDDGPTAFYRQQCLRHLAEPATRAWTGVVRLTEK